MNRCIAPLWELVASMTVGARPTVAGDGANITTWRRSSYTPERAAITFDGTVAAALSSPAGGAEGIELWGYIGAPGSEQWRLLGILRAGAAINIVSATQGYAEEIEHVGIAKRLAIAATVSAGVVTARFVPLEELQ